MCAYSRHLIQSYIDEFCWRKAFADTAEAAFFEIFKALRTHFPLDSKQPILSDLLENENDLTWLHDDDNTLIDEPNEDFERVQDEILHEEFKVDS